MKKYDCSKVLDYVHEQRRLCKSYVGCCINCPMHGARCTESMGQEEIIILQKWSDSHPEHTRADKFMGLLRGTEFEGLLSGVWRVGTTYDEDVKWWNEVVE